MNESALWERLDKIIFLLEKANKQPPLILKVGNGIATGVGILGILSVVDIIKSWLGG